MKIEKYTYNDYIIGKKYKIENEEENKGLVFGNADSDCLMKVIAVDTISNIDVGDIVWYDHSKSSTYRIDGEDYIVVKAESVIVKIEV